MKVGCLVFSTMVALSADGFSLVAPPSVAALRGKADGTWRARIQMSPSPLSADNNKEQNEAENATEANSNPEKTLRQRLNESTTSSEAMWIRLEKDVLKELDRHEKELRLQLGESIEEMRERLLEQTSDFSVRDSANQGFIDTRQQIKAELRQLRNQEEDKIKALRTGASDTMTQMVEVLSPLMLHFESLEELCKALEQQYPVEAEGYREIFKSPSGKYKYENTSVAKELKQTIDRFRSDMEDQLDDLNENMRFQIRIAADAKK